MDSPLHITRRLAFLLGSSWTLAAAAGLDARAAAPDAPFATIESIVGGRLGVAALDTASGARIAYRTDERFAMCSTFKWLLVAAVLARVDRGDIALARRIAFSAADLLSSAPVTRARLGEGGMPVADLCQAAVEVSDNTAANLLLGLIGGPAGLTADLRRWGDSVTRLDRIEPDLNSNQASDDRDTTTPAAMVRTMNAVLVGEVLSTDARALLIGWMKNCQTGRERLRAGLPADWTVGDKTGSGANGAFNDVAILWPPSRPPILVAVYLTDTKASPQALRDAYGAIGRIVATSFG